MDIGTTRCIMKIAGWWDFCYIFPFVFSSFSFLLLILRNFNFLLKSTPIEKSFWTHAYSTYKNYKFWSSLGKFYFIIIIICFSSNLLKINHVLILYFVTLPFGVILIIHISPNLHYFDKNWSIIMHSKRQQRTFLAAKRPSHKSSST